MKRKRTQNEENIVNNSDKKLRVDEEKFDESIDINSVLDNSLIEKKEFVLTREIADNSILCDIAGNNWRIGVPVGAGSFGEIYLASNDTVRPVDFCNANYVTKIEPHSNGPLFVEIHCLLNVNKEIVLENEEEKIEENECQEVLGIPRYIASGSHYFNDSRYRFLIMPRYKADLHSITKYGRLSQKHFLILANQVIDVLQRLHEKSYVHSDIKAQNIMIGQFNTSINGFHAHQKNHQPLLNGFKKNTNRQSIQFPGSNPLRSCRIKEDSDDKSHHTVYKDMVRSHYLRPGKTIDYAIDEEESSRSSHEQENDTNEESDDDEDFQLSPRKKTANRRSNKSKLDRKNSKSPTKNGHHHQERFVATKTTTNEHNNNSNSNSNNDHVYIIDYGLATKFVDTNGEHRPFCMDQRRAHDGTIEFTSRDAHFGAHSRRSDLECFGYNLIYWSEGYLPWKDEKLKDQPEIVHRLKEIFMTDVKEMLKLLYGKDVPNYLGKYMQYVGQLEFDEEPNYCYLKKLFEKEFLKLGFNESDMQLNLNEIRDECEPIDRTLSEHDLLMANITDLKTATKLGFLVATTDSVDGNETLVKPKESLSLNLSCKASPKNLRSKEKGLKGKRPKRQHKVLTEKEIVNEKMAKGKKLSVQEIAILDPEQIGRDRAEKEYEKFDDKAYYQTPQRYKGNPTYAIIEIENRLRSKHGGSAIFSHNSEVEPIKGYTKPMMDILKKQQMIVEQQLNNDQNSPISTYQKRNRDGLRNVIKHTQKNITYQNEVNLKKEHKKVKTPTARYETTSNINKQLVDESEIGMVSDVPMETQIVIPKRGRGRPRKQVNVIKKIPVEVCDSNVDNLDVEEKSVANDIEKEEEEEEVVAEPVPEVFEKKRKANKKRTKVSQKNIFKNEVIETEEDSVYYDIPGEGSNDGINAYSDTESDDIIQPTQKRLRKRDFSTSEENSNQSSTTSVTKLSNIKRHRDRYYKDEDFQVCTDEASNQTSISCATKTTVSSFKPAKRIKPSSSSVAESSCGKFTRNKTKSRSTSRTVASEPISETEEDEEEASGSEFELDEASVDESEGIDFDQDLSDEENDNDNGTEDEEETNSEIDDDDDDSIDIKYSPIKTRHARKRISYFNMKQMRGRRMNMLDEDVRNFRLVSTRG